MDLNAKLYEQSTLLITQYNTNNVLLTGPQISERKSGPDQKCRSHSVQQRHLKPYLNAFYKK